MTKRRQVSKQLFCSTCGRPAEKWPAPRGGNPNWKADWRNSCRHVGEPVRMGPRRAAELRETYDAQHEAWLARQRQAIADCAGNPS